MLRKRAVSIGEPRDFDGPSHIRELDGELSMDRARPFKQAGGQVSQVMWRKCSAVEMDSTLGGVQEEAAGSTTRAGSMAGKTQFSVTSTLST